MGIDVVETARPAGMRTGEAAPAPTLTRRASLNVLQALLDYGAKLAVGLIVIPVLVSGLGRSLYGVWEVLGRLAGYMAAADGRPTQALRLVIANQQANPDHAAKRRYVGGALVVWLLCLPLVVLVGAGLVWLAPVLTKAPAELRGTVRTACALVAAGLVLTGLVSMPESVLRGLNLGYKRMGVQASLSAVGGALMIGAVSLGLGLTGLAAAQLVVVLLTGLCFWLLARRYVPWFGVARPAASDVKPLLGMSLWLASGDLIAKLLLASDVIVLGAVVSTAAVTTYVLTGYSARLAVNLYDLSANAIAPSLGDLIGRGTYDRAAAVRRELHGFTWVFMTTAGGTILLWNRSFLDLWVGPGNYAGAWVNLLVMLLVSQTAFIRSEGYFIDAALQPRLRVTVSALAAVLTLALSVLLTRAFGMVGLCVGVIAGRTTQTVAYPILVRSCLNRAARASVMATARPLATMIALFIAATWLGQRVSARHWAEWAVYVALTAGLAACAALGALPAETRRAVVRRVRALLGPALSRRR